ncbi:hypothetical protein ACIBL6_47760 [Streptomyces sp. NPDC050400]|uniref:hypothetical protein n=1 Tax=Streptomyces sp. NPDC050400 TaxID=3365610 RepID=UPI00378D7110
MSAAAVKATAYQTLAAERPAPLRSVSGGRAADGRPDDPLRLGRSMRLRLRAAVQALLTDPSVSELADPAKLGAVVLYAKSRAPEGRKTDNQASIWVAQLGLWLGVGESSVHRYVLEPLRRADVLHTKEARNAVGRPTGLDCLVMPLWRARKSGGAGHPLALSKAELATLLRLVEALFGPGWSPEDREPTPPGLLAGRHGKGAATDRLGLLLMVLNTPASGWLPLHRGSVRKREKAEGRAAATLARMLGCSAPAARKVLARLERADAVARPRRETPTRMNGRGRLLLLPVARAYGRKRACVEAVSASGAVFSQRPGSAGGDLAPAGTAGALGTPGIAGGDAAGIAEIQERPGSAEFHTDHAGVVTSEGRLQVDGGFSGEAAGGEDRQPDRACPREEPVVEVDLCGVVCEPVVAEAGPLRGEQPEISPVVETDGQPQTPVDEQVPPTEPVTADAVTIRASTERERTRLQRRVAPPVDLDVRVVLESAAGLWTRLSVPQQRLVETACRAQLKQLQAVLPQPGDASARLAGRLRSRLRETGGEALIAQPFPWLTHRGLVQRPACPDPRCDDGTRLDTGGDCANCHNVIDLRRARRKSTAAHVDRQLPHLSDAARQRVIEEQLRAQTATDALLLARRHEQAAVERQERAAALEERRVQEQREQAAAAAAAAQRQATPCRTCGAADAAGHCQACESRESTERLLRDAVDLAVATRVDLTHPSHLPALIAQCTADTRALLTRTCERTAEPTSDPSERAQAEERVARRIRIERRQAALQRLRGSTAAIEAGDAAHAAHRARFPQAPPHDAEQAADTAELQAAEQLLNARLDALADRHTTELAHA